MMTQKNLLVIITSFSTAQISYSACANILEQALSYLSLRLQMQALDDDMLKVVAETQQATSEQYRAEGFGKISVEYSDLKQQCTQKLALFNQVCTQKAEEPAALDALKKYKQLSPAQRVAEIAQLTKLSPAEQFAVCTIESAYFPLVSAPESSYKE